jgi:L-ascorbate metabolism protein UlaG (beta-lactamase superfamily)
MREFGLPQSRIIVAEEEWIQLSSGMRVLPVPAAHKCIERNDKGQSRYVGYIIETEGKRIYHSGDCSVHPEIVSLLRSFPAIDLALLPVNECNYYRDCAGIIGNMSVREAFSFAVEIGAKTVVPIHFDMFLPNCTFEEEIQAIYRHLRPAFQLIMPLALTGL